MPELHQTLRPSQVAEWGRARVALVCEPGIETLFDLLQPSAANFLRLFSLAQAQSEHRAFRRSAYYLRDPLFTTRSGVVILDRSGVNAIPIDFAALTGGYGGPHCSTQVLVRE